MADLNDIVSRICPICGESFIPAPYHVYVLRGGTGNTPKTLVYCSWHCYLAGKRAKAEEKKNKKINKESERSER